MGAEGTTSTRLRLEQTGGLCDIELLHPAGTFAPTPATLTAIQAIVRHRDLLTGTGIDWGTGIGALAIVAAHMPTVDRVVALEIDGRNVDATTLNAERCGVADRVRAFRADSYEPCSSEGRAVVAALEDRVDFIVANPPSSSPRDDGFEFRRVVIRGASRFLRPGGRVFLSVSQQYGEARVEALLGEAPGFTHGGILASTDGVAFDMTRPDLLEDVTGYAAEEGRGGLPYSFRHPTAPTEELTAREALALYTETGRSPLSRWQSHLFTWDA